MSKQVISQSTKPLDSEEIKNDNNNNNNTTPVLPINSLVTPSSAFVCPKNEHGLQTPWSIYWYNKPNLSDTSRDTYLNNLRSLGTVNSIESFFRHYCHLKRPSMLEHGFNIEIFRANLIPAWESFPSGGCWIIRIAIKEKFLDKLWEELIMATLGEEFKTPELVGIGLSIRSYIANITVWNNDNHKNSIRFTIGERLKELLYLDEDSTIEYKFFSASLKDKSTHRNAERYTYSVVQ